MKYYSAHATMENVFGKQWNVAIYSHYESKEEAEDGVKRFVRNYKNGFPKVISTKIQTA